MFLVVWGASGDSGCRVRYKPHEVELDTTLKCFVPDFLPAVGEMDAFIKVAPPALTH